METPLESPLLDLVYINISYTNIHYIIPGAIIHIISWQYTAEVASYVASIKNLPKFLGRSKTTHS